MKKIMICILLVYFLIINSVPSQGFNLKKPSLSFISNDNTLKDISPGETKEYTFKITNTKYNEISDIDLKYHFEFSFQNINAKDILDLSYKLSYKSGENEDEIPLNIQDGFPIRTYPLIIHSLKEQYHIFTLSITWNDTQTDPKGFANKTMKILIDTIVEECISLKYTYKLPQHLVYLQTKGFKDDIFYDKNTIVYNDDATLSIRVKNNYAKDINEEGKDVKYKISIHYGDGESLPDLSKPHKNFQLIVNDIPCDTYDTTNIYTISKDMPENILNIRFIWDGILNMNPSEFIYVKISKLIPYYRESIFKVTVLGKMFISIDKEDILDPFSNEMKKLTLSTTKSFGAGLLFHKMKIKLPWDNSLSIDDTNNLIIHSINDPLNSHSIVNGGSLENRFFYIYLNPSSKETLNFYKNGNIGFNNDFIQAEVEIIGADIPKYDLWNSNNINNGYSGWEHRPDGIPIIP